MLNQIMKNHEAKHSTTAVAASPEDVPNSRSATPASTAKEPSVPDESLRMEVEQLGSELGKRASDQLALNQDDQ